MDFNIQGFKRPPCVLTGTNRNIKHIPGESANRLSKRLSRRAAKLRYIVPCVKLVDSEPQPLRLLR
uniref:Tail protein n=1 Tax=uncultured marine virus TaxID=186617 RepID=A0A0F7L5P8_9VIRU|nr:tail protein [uncultured marine virus]